MKRFASSLLHSCGFSSRQASRQNMQSVHGHPKANEEMHVSSCSWVVKARVIGGNGNWSSFREIGGRT